VSLGQFDGRVPDFEKKPPVYDVYPFRRTMTSAVLFIYELEAGAEKIEDIRQAQRLKYEL
jgi:hypothetical protein